MLPKELPRKKLLILGSLVLVLLLALLISLVQQKRLLQQKIMTEEVGQRELTDLPSPQLVTIQTPSITFASYNTSNKTVALPQTAKVYTFRTEYSLPYVSIIAQKLGLTETKQEVG